MQSIHTIRIDLPLKALVWRDESDNTWLSCNDPAWLAGPAGLGHEVDSMANVMRLSQSRGR